MATFEERELVDYTMKKIETMMKPQSFMIKDLDKFNIRIKKQEERLKKTMERIENLENKIKNLEKESSFGSESNSSESE